MKFHLASTMLMGLSLAASELWIETEQFSQKGGWVVDQQFMDFMGSPYLLAHGMGKPVEDAVTQLDIKQEGTYFVWAHTYNWTSPWTAPWQRSPVQRPSPRERQRVGLGPKTDTAEITAVKRMIS